MSDALDRLTLRQILDEADVILARFFSGAPTPEGLKLVLVQALRKAETRGMQACIEHFGLCDDCSPLVGSLADANSNKDHP